MPKLIIQFQGQECSVELKEGSNTIGRSSTCTIPVRDTNMSREHCEIVVQGEIAVVFDKGSMNGTLLNGVKVLERKLVPGDQIQIGASRLWFQVKKDDTAPAAVQSDTKSKGDTSRRKTAGLKSAPGLLVKDYAVWSPARRVPIGILIGVLAGVLLIAGLFVAARLLRPGTEEEADPNNLLGVRGTFEGTGGEPEGWRVASGLKSKIATELTRAHRGRGALVLEKSGEPSDILAEVVGMEEYALGHARRVQFSAWSRSEGFSGLVALKVAWTTGVRGAIVLEECSAPLSKPAEWVNLSNEFTAPAGAGAFQVALVAIGRSGRVFFDDVRVEARPGQEPPRESSLGGFRVGVGASGVFRVSVDNHPMLSNVHLALVSEKEGVLPQAIANSRSPSSDEKMIQVQGRMFNPVDLREVEFTQQLFVTPGGEFGIKYVLPGGALQQIEQVHLVATLPRAERVVKSPVSEAVEVRFRTEGLDAVLEYLEPTHVTEVRNRGATTLVQAFPVPRGGAQVEVLVRMRVGTSIAAAEDPLKAAREAVAKRGEYGTALNLLTASPSAVRDPEQRRAMEAERAKFEDLAIREWSEAQGAHFKATISRRLDLIQAGLERLGRFERAWWGVERLTAKVAPLREELEKLESEVNIHQGEERARRQLERARQFMGAGKRALAREVCETILNSYRDTPAAKEAAELLKSLQGNP